MLAEEVSVLLSVLEISLCEVALTVAASPSPHWASAGTWTLTSTSTPAPGASGPALFGASVVQLLPVTSSAKLSAQLPVLVSRSE